MARLGDATRRLRPGSWSLTRRSFLAGSAVAPVAAPVILRAEPPVAIGLTPVFMLSDLTLRRDLESYFSEAVARPVQLVTRRTYQEITALLVAEQLAAAWICGYPYIQYRERLELLAVPVWRGRPLYQSYIITAAGRRTRDVPDLGGDVHAFSDPDSNSGHLATQAYLARRGEQPATFFRKTFYTYSHRNVVRAVASGLADSGSVDGYVWEVMRESEPDLTAATRVVRRSDWMGFPPIAAARSRAAAETSSAIAAAWQNMQDTKHGRAILAQLRLDRFQPPVDRLFDPIAENYRLVRAMGA